VRACVGMSGCQYLCVCLHIYTCERERARAIAQSREKEMEGVFADVCVRIHGCVYIGVVFFCVYVYLLNMCVFAFVCLCVSMCVFWYICVGVRARVCEYRVRRRASGGAARI